MEQEYIRKAVQHLKDGTPCPPEIVYGVLSYVEFLEQRIRQLKAAVILGDAGWGVMEMRAIPWRRLIRRFVHCIRPGHASFTEMHRSTVYLLCSCGRSF